MDAAIRSKTKRGSLFGREVHASLVPPVVGVHSSPSSSTSVHPQPRKCWAAFGITFLSPRKRPFGSRLYTDLRVPSWAPIKTFLLQSISYNAIHLNGVLSCAAWY